MSIYLSQRPHIEKMNIVNRRIAKARKFRLSVSQSDQKLQSLSKYLSGQWALQKKLDYDVKRPNMILLQ